MEKLTYYCDDIRHLVCLPFSIENLHRMAEDLGIKRCWYEGGEHPHYDIPKRRIQEIQSKCKVIGCRSLHQIIVMSKQIREINFTQQDVQQLQKDYNEAIKGKKDLFSSLGTDFYTPYAGYLLEWFKTNPPKS